MPRPRSTQVPVYLCPSVSDTSLNYTVKDGGGNPLAQFAARITWRAGQYDVWDLPDPQLQQVANGVFFRNGKITIAQISDGTSDTVFFGEQTPYHSDSTWVGIVPARPPAPRRGSPTPAATLPRRRSTCIAGRA